MIKTHLLKNTQNFICNKLEVSIYFTQPVNVDNFLTHFASTNITTAQTNDYHLRSLISNSTRFMQPLDQHVGRFIQVAIHNKYR